MKYPEFLADDAAQDLERTHWDGHGCGSNTSTSSCSHCYGPSPMSSTDIAEQVIAFVGPRIEGSVKTDLTSKLHLEKSLHDGPIWKAAIDRCIQIIQEKDGVSL